MPATSLNDERYDIDTRPCRNCNGQLKFDISTQKLRCPHCGSIEEIVHSAGAAVIERPFDASVIAGHGRIAGAETHLADEKEIVCQYCGGRTTFVGTLTATKCPYCATPIQRTDVHEAPDRLVVDGVLPFQITERAASELLDQWVKKRWFAPNEFKKYATQGSFSSVYSAYFTFDADATTDYRGERGVTRTRTVRQGNETKTVVETDWYPKSGRVHNTFDDVTVLANTGFDAKYVGQLEPWPTASLQPFSRDFMAGHLAKSYDRDIETCFGDARQRMEQEIDSTVRRDIGGDKQRVHHKNTQWSNLTYKHVLLPIWLLTVMYEGRAWQVFMNGATGEIHGERPWSKIKIAAAVIGVLIVVGIILAIRAATQ